jgi:hypothetical protein
LRTSIGTVEFRWLIECDCGIKVDIGSEYGNNGSSEIGKVST